MAIPEGGAVAAAQVAKTSAEKKPRSDALMVCWIRGGLVGGVAGCPFFRRDEELLHLR